MAQSVPYLGKISYKGVEFYYESSNVAGGKKNSVKEFVNSDFQLIEELGLKQRAYSITGYVALLKDETDYKSKCEALLTALESPGPGTLVHPFHGIVPNCVVLSYTLSESTNDLGVGSLSIEFGITNVSVGPVQDVLTPAASSEANKAVLNQSSSMIEKGYSASTKLLGVYSAAKTKVAAVGAKFDSAVKFAVKSADDTTRAIKEPTDALANSIADFQRDAVKLASNPIRLAASIKNVFETINATIATAAATYEVYVGFFGFGWTDDIELRFDTVANRTKTKNARLLNDTMNASALSGAYASAVLKDYKTTDEIDADVSILDAQLKALEERPGIDPDLLASLWDARQSAMQLLASARLKASSVIDIEVENVSARALSYLYYGTDDRATEIARLNTGNGIILEGTVKILSQ